MADDRKDLPPASAPNFLERVREVLSVYLGNRGDVLNRGVTLRDLVDGGFGTLDGRFTAGNRGVSPLVPAPTTTTTDTAPDLTPPPTPTGFTASAAISNLFVECDAQLYTQGHGHAKSKLYGATHSGGALPVFADAVLLTQFQGTVFSYATNPATTWHLWLTWESVDGVESVTPAGGTNGVTATTGQDVSLLITALSGEITSSELSVALNSRIDLIDGPAATVGTIPNRFSLVQGQIEALSNYPDYDNATAYAIGDIVKYNGAIYKATAATTGNLPTDTAFWLKIGDYSSMADAVAAHTSEINTLTTGLGAEITSRETFATQMRGGYTGNDLSALTSGLLYDERVARSTATAGFASSLNVVAATASSKTKITRSTTAPADPAVNDIWIDTTIGYSANFFDADYSVPKYKQYQWTGSAWLDVSDSEIHDNSAAIELEKVARATQNEAIARRIETLNAYVLDGNTTLTAAIQNEATVRATTTEAVARSVTTLNAQVNDVSTGLPATRAILQTDYSTTATTNTAISDATTVLAARVAENQATALDRYYTKVAADGIVASHATFLRAYSDLGSKTFRQTTAPTQRGLDPQTSVVVPLRSGDVWFDTDDANKPYVWNGTAWVVSADGGPAASFSSWVSETYTPAIAGLTDSKIESWFSNADPSLTWSGTTASHTGDFWYSATVKLLKRWSGTEWTLVQDQAAIDAAQAASDAQDTADGKIVTFAQPGAPTAVAVGDVWIDTDDKNKLYRWDGTTWVALRDGTIADVDARVATVESARIGYSRLIASGSPWDNAGAIVDKATMDAYNTAHPPATLEWVVGLPIAQAIKQLTITANGVTGTIENRMDAVATQSGSMHLEQKVRIGSDGSVVGYGLSGDVNQNGVVTNSAFIANVNKFAVTTPETAVPVWEAFHVYAVNAMVRVAAVDGKLLVCKGAGTSGNSQPDLSAAVGTKILDGTVVWQVASRTPFAVLSAPTDINGLSVPAGVYIDAAFVLNATIQNEQVANSAIDDAKIADLSVTKLTAGSIAVGEYIQSTGYVAGSAGWKINGNGDAEFSGVIVRGTVHASAGLIGGNTITSSRIASPAYSDVSPVGWKLESGGAFRFGDASKYISWDGTNLRIVGDVYIGTSGPSLASFTEPPIISIGDFASAPAVTGRKKNEVYKNTTDGNSYILSADAGVWNLWLAKGLVGDKGDTGDPGATGTRTAVLMVYQWAATAPTVFPSGTSTYTWASATWTGGTLGSWTSSPAASVTGQTLWMAQQIYTDATTSATASVAWSTSTAIAVGGAGTNGGKGDAGNNGSRTAALEMYQWAASAPTTFPSGTSTYTWASGTFTNPATLNSWAATPSAPVAGQTLWGCTQIYSDVLTSATSSVTWGASTAYAIGAAGTNGNNGNDGSPGVRGSRQLYLTDAAYVSSYGSANYATTATAAIATAAAGSTPTTPMNGDTVTFTNGTSYTNTLTYNGTAWAAPGVVIDGSLLVSGSITTTKIAANAITAASGILADAAITSAKIEDAAITSAKIGTAEVGTLKIAGEAVTVTRCTTATNTLPCGLGPTGLPVVTEVLVADSVDGTYGSAVIVVTVNYSAASVLVGSSPESGYYEPVAATFRLYRGSTLISTWTGTGSWTFKDVPAGVAVYSVTMENFISAQTRSIVVFGAKR